MIENKKGSFADDENIFFIEFIDCLFERNGAIYRTQVNTSLYKNGNGSAIQIGLSETSMIAIFTNCQFLSNYADNDGDAISVGVKGNVKITNCTFIDNTAGTLSTNENYANGGALFLQSDFSIENCLFDGNKAFYYQSRFRKIKGKGGAIFI